jgi:hypothetical protein
VKIQKTTQLILGSSCIAMALCLAGCATSGPEAGSDAHFPSEYRATDGRPVAIGKSRSEDGGWTFKDDHLEKCWIADNFNFTGYDTLYVAPTLSTAKFHDDEAALHEWAKTNLVAELSAAIRSHGMFNNIVTSEAEIKPGVRFLKMENTITEYSKGGGAGRYWAGMYGAGQPVLRVEGKMLDGEKTMFRFQARRSGVSALGRTFGGFMRDEAVQIDDIRSMSVDLTDFMSAIAGKYTARN